MYNAEDYGSSRGTRRVASVWPEQAAVPDSTGRIPGTGYSLNVQREPFVDEGFEERWAAWQARGAAHNRTTRRKLFVLAIILALSVAAWSIANLNGLSWFR